MAAGELYLDAAELAGTLPAQYRAPPGSVFRLRSVSATFNGAGASGTFLPCLALYSQDGKLIGRWFPSTSMAAGDSGEVSYGPFLGRGGAGSVPAGDMTVVDFVTKTFISNLIITTTVEANAVKIIESNSVTFDGTTTHKIEYYTPDFRIVSSGGGTFGDLGGFINLWMDNTNLGLIRYYDVGPGVEYAMPASETIYITPPAGSHTFSVRGWLQFAGSEQRIIATSDRLPTTLTITSLGQSL